MGLIASITTILSIIIFKIINHPIPSDSVGSRVLINNNGAAASMHSTRIGENHIQQHKQQRSESQKQTNHNSQHKEYIPSSKHSQSSSHATKKPQPRTHDKSVTKLSKPELYDMPLPPTDIHWHVPKQGTESRHIL